ncbi:MAG: membrane protein insertase YidC [Rhodobacteraceae bacterium]|nr:membrane protein insertase YidC [Paracoccaceae bacterium]
MDDQNKNLILATALSFAVIVLWFVLFPPPEPEAVPQDAETAQSTATTPSAAPATPGATAGADAAVTVAAEAEGTRLPIATERLAGSILTTGGRIDDLTLSGYREELELDAETVRLFSPVGQPNAYYALHGWSPAGDLPFDAVPSADTQWSVIEGASLGVGTPVTLGWDNGQGQRYTKQIAVDENYMFTITQTVENTGAAPVRMAPYGVLARHGEPQDLSGFFIIHEGLVQMSDGELNETNYDKMPDFDFVEREGARAEVTQVAENGWIGFTDHYWMSTLIPSPGTPFKSVAKYDARSDVYQTETVAPTLTVAPGETAQVVTQLFAGAKEWEMIRNYEKSGIDGFLDSIDWGWFFFLTKPIFAMLHWINGIIGNMGWSIIVLTLVIKAILFPLAYKSYVSMAKMKELQPEMEKLKESAGDDRQKMQKGMMELYKKNKVNPASGCLPILMQIPIFFSLYKVIFVTIELRHAPWLGWINDLSAPDPSSILNLFGLLPWSTPEVGSIFFIFSLGVLPILLGISMWLQQKLNPSPSDPTQKMIFAWMPWVFMFMLGSFASGLVIYWIANNTITFTQQYAIMRSQGYKPDLWGNIASGFKRKAKEDS